MRVRVCLLLALLATQVCAESADVAEMDELAPKEGDDPPSDPQGSGPRLDGKGFAGARQRAPRAMVPSTLCEDGC